MKMLK
jgi:hypothetical protein